MADAVAVDARVARRRPADDRAAAGATGSPGGDWPRTTRPLPWLIAGFLAMVWLVPFDAIDLPIQLPFDTKLDRLALATVAVAWILAVAAGGPGAPRLRSSAVNLPILAFAGVAVASVLLNLDALATLGQTGLALKKLVLLGSYVLFFYIAATSVRATEVRPFAVFLVGLSCVAALAVVYEYRTGTNLLYDWARQLLPAGVTVDVPPGDSKFGRPSVVGPTEHGLAIATLFAMVLPFAIAGAFAGHDRRTRLLSLAATGLIVAGSVGTLRKTGAVAPAAALLVLLLYRPRAMLRLLPAGVMLLAAVQVLAPGAMTRVKAQLFGGVATSSSTQGRTNDYEAVLPDVLAHPVLGRGYGTYDSGELRILDNDYLGMLIETGFVGVAAYACLVGAVVWACHRMIRGGGAPASTALAVAAAAAAVAFGVATALFDVMSFPQAPYMFFFVAGVVVVLTGRETSPVESPSRARRVAPAAATAPSGSGA